MKAQVLSGNPFTYTNKNTGAISLGFGLILGAALLGIEVLCLRRQ